MRAKTLTGARHIRTLVGSPDLSQGDAGLLLGPLSPLSYASNQWFAPKPLLSLQERGSLTSEYLTASRVVLVDLLSYRRDTVTFGMKRTRLDRSGPGRIRWGL